MKELIAAAIIAATLLACSNAQAQPYNGPSLLLVLEQRAIGRFELIATELKDTWDECAATARMIEYGGANKARCTAAIPPEDPEITAEAQGYLTY